MFVYGLLHEETAAVTLLMQCTKSDADVLFHEENDNVGTVQYLIPDSKTKCWL